MARRGKNEMFIECFKSLPSLDGISLETLQEAKVILDDYSAKLNEAITDFEYNRELQELKKKYGKV